MSILRCSECNCLIDTDFDEEATEGDPEYPMCKDCREDLAEAYKEDCRLDDPRHEVKT